MKKLLEESSRIGKCFAVLIFVALPVLLSGCSNSSGNSQENCTIEPFHTASVVEKEVNNLDLTGKTICDIIKLLGQPAHYIKLGAASANNSRHLLLYRTQTYDPTVLYIWIKGKYYHKSKLDEFSGFDFYEMSNIDFWEQF